MGTESWFLKNPYKTRLSVFWVYGVSTLILRGSGSEANPVLRVPGSGDLRGVKCQICYKLPWVVGFSWFWVKVRPGSCFRG